MNRREEAKREYAAKVAATAKVHVLMAIRQRIDQAEAAARATQVAVEAMDQGKREADVLIAAGEAYFAFIKETCGVK